MAVEAGRPPLGRSLASVSLWSRLYGFGSIYAKTIRDSRLAFLIVAGLLGGIMLAGIYAIATGFPTPASRLQMASFVEAMPPALQGLAGDRSTSERSGVTCPGSTDPPSG